MHQLRAQLRILAVGLIAGPLLAFGAAGTAAAGVDEVFTHWESLPSPNPVPNGGTITFSVHVGNIGDEFDDMWADHLFSIYAVTGVSGDVTYSPCQPISIWTAGGGILQNVTFDIDERYATTGTHGIQAVIYEWDSQGSCGDTDHVRDVWHVDTTITITDPVAQTITFADPADRSYGDASFALGATASSGQAVTYTTTGPCHVIGGNAVIDGAGTCQVTASQAGGNGWAAATAVVQSFDIARRPLHLTVANASKLYGDPLPTFSFSGSGFAPGEDESDLYGTPSYPTTASDFSAVGDYAVGLTGVSGYNYSFSITPGNLHVGAAPLTATANNAMKTQGDPNPALSATMSGFVLGESDTVMTSAPACTTTAVDSSPVGTYPITCTGGVAPNYSITSYVDGTLSVTAGPLASIVVSPDGAITNAGVPVTYSAEGFDVNGNSVGDVTASTAFSIGGGTCSVASCGSTVAGDHTVTGAIGSITDTAVLHVSPVGPDHIVISPNGPSVTSGQSVTFTVELFDEYGNSLGDVTAMTVFGVTGGTCTGAVCTATGVGDHTVAAALQLHNLTFRSGTVLHVTQRVAGATSPPTGTNGGGQPGGSSILFLLLIATALGALGFMATSVQRRSALLRR